MADNKPAFGLIELLIVAVIAVIIYFTCFNSATKRQNPFEERVRVNTQQQAVEEKIQQIEDTKALRKRIENNLKGDY